MNPIGAAASNVFESFDLLLKTYVPGISYIEGKTYLETWKILKLLESFPSFFPLTLFFFFSERSWVQLVCQAQLNVCPRAVYYMPQRTVA